MKGDTSSSRFHLKSYLRLTSIFTPTLLIGIALFLALLPTILFTRHDSPSSQLTVLGILLLIVRILFPLFALLMVVFAGMVLFTQTLPNFVSYLEISEQGLEYKYWPTYHIRCSWDDVQAITQRREVITADVILLHRAIELGRPITMKMRKKLGMDTQYFIPLNILEGWPTGKLANTLRRYAPHLFDEKHNSDQEID